MRRIIFTGVFIIGCFLLQTTVFRYFDFGGVVPNLLLIFTSSYALMRGEKEGMIAGLICGLLVDIFFGSFLGLFAVLYLYVGFIDGLFHKVFYPESILLPMSIITVSDLAFGFLCYLVMFLFQNRYHLWFYLIHVILPETIYTVLAALFLYPLVQRLNDRLEEIERRSAKKFV